MKWLVNEMTDKMIISQWYDWLMKWLVNEMAG